MALINKIREKSGWAIGIIAVSLILFIVGGDLLSGNSSLFGGNQSQNVGEIGGEEISIKEFQQELDQLKYNYQTRSGRPPSEEEMPMLREQVWNKLIERIAYKKQYDKLGIVISDDELYDMVQGENIHATVQQSFTNPQTNEFSKEMIGRYMQMLKSDSANPQAKAEWANFEKDIAAMRAREKYENLLKLSNYVTKQEAKREYIAQTAQADVKFLYVPYFSIPDSTIKVTDDQLEEYLNKHKDEFKAEDTRNIQYVSFSILPSKKDSAYFYEEIKRLAKGLAAAENDSAFARANTDVPAPQGYVGIDQIPQQLQGEIATFIKGGMYGPYREGETYAIYKLADIKEDTVSSVKASHILFRADNGANKEEARKKAQEVLQQIKGGASFEEMARIHGSDGTAQNGGDLGWFSQGRMVKPFENAVFGFNGTGLIPNLVETDFGYHIIKVTQPKTNKKYKLLSVQKVISAGEETTEEAYRKASEFAGTTESSEEFKAKIKKNPSVTTFTADKIRPNDNNINTLNGAREIVRWAFDNETEIGEVSEVFSLSDQYVVATLTGKTDKEEVTVDNFREELTSKVRNEIKAKQIMDKLGKASGDLDAMAQTYGPQAQVNSAQDVTLNSNTLQGVGFDPIAVGRIFGLKKGQRSKPFRGENGILVVELTDMTEAPEIADYSQYKNQVDQTYTSRAQYFVGEAVKDNAKIEDNRHRFY